MLPPSLDQTNKTIGVATGVVTGWTLKDRVTTNRRRKIAIMDRRLGIAYQPNRQTQSEVLLAVLVNRNLPATNSATNQCSFFELSPISTNLLAKLFQLAKQAAICAGGIIFEVAPQKNNTLSSKSTLLEPWPNSTERSLTPLSAYQGATSLLSWVSNL